MRFSVDGKEYSVVVATLSRKATVKDGKNTTTTLSGIFKRDVVGTYYEYTLDIHWKDSAQYDELYEVLTAPQNEPHRVVLPYGQATLEFDAYITEVSDDLKASRKSINRWGNMSIEFKAREPQRRIK